jgi:hypothetical protein
MKLLHIKAFAISLLLTGMCLKADAQSNDLPTRSESELELLSDDYDTYYLDIPESEFVHANSSIQLIPGESLFVELELADWQIKRMTSVKENLNPQKTLIISFQQQTDGELHKRMIIEIYNPFERMLEYKANIFLLPDNKWYPANVLSVYPKSSSEENWTDVIETILLYQLEFH